MKSAATTECARLHVRLRGAVQGVGFRPFVYRLAHEMNLAGWVNNSTEGVLVEAEGPRALLDQFLDRVQSDCPAAANILGVEPSYLPPAGYSEFVIRDSEAGGAKSATILPDLASCPDCVREIFDPGNRRNRYPFANCTNCGPRYSILLGIPYDRPNTTMRGFALCPACRVEYDDPRDRRFHAQPNACPVCGPQLALWDGCGRTIARRDEALQLAAKAIRAGQIVAVKGLGGFQLLVDARNTAAVRELRSRKHREEKPFAVLYPNLAAVRADCAVSPLEEQILLGPQAPIVLLERKRNTLAEDVAPDSPETGAMLPYTPLHHLLMADLGFPVVATSGNLSDEPICTDEHEALTRLRGIADLMLVHDRPIARHVDDSVVRVVLGRELVLRCARGYAPVSVALPPASPPILAFGAHQKCAPALAVGDRAVIGQHIGDLETERALSALAQAASDLPNLHDLAPAIAACDLHPDYVSSRLARRSELPVVAVQHHYAHVLSCMAENALAGPVLGVSWDGTGLGDDGAIWGGEFLAVDAEGYTRVADLRTFPLPGGEKSIEEPRRTALGLLYTILGDDIFRRNAAPSAKREAWSDIAEAFTKEEVVNLRTMLRNNVNCPVTSSAGRLFDAAAALTGLRYETAYEGQAAMLFEFEARRAAADDKFDAGYEFSIVPSGGCLIVDWEPAIRELLHDRAAGRPRPEIARMFHHGLAKAVVEVARRVGIADVALTGGCFQNKLLTESAVLGLRDSGFRAHTHSRVPPNDGGIALGQIMAAMRAKRR
jgi:hydrogenase maturation protein HypF